MIIPFGKYKGLDANHVVQTDRSYIEWMMNSYLEKSDDPQWGSKNVARAEELKAILNMPPQAQTIANEAVEISNKISSAREAEIGKKHDEVLDVGKKLDALSAKIDKLSDEIAVISWFVKGGKEEPTKKKDDICWEE